MKKLAAKITLFIIAGLIVNIFLLTAHAVFTDDECKKEFGMTCQEYTTKRQNDRKAQVTENLMLSKLKVAQDNPCISNDKNSKDREYAYVIIEEPLNLETSGTPGTDNTLNRVCFRNEIAFLVAGRHYSATAFSQECAQVIKDNAFTDDEIKEYNISYSCKPVQVILSKGGASLLTAYLSTIYKWAAGLVGLIAVVVITISGIQISAAGGDTQAIENSKNRIIKSISGIVILFLSGLILYTINPTFFTK
ncbi:MAG: pilin [Candidatus Peregrinibacteria bacterium]